MQTLDRSRQDRADAAREALGAEHGCDVMSLAERVGRLEWHLAEMLALVGELAGP